MCCPPLRVVVVGGVAIVVVDVVVVTVVVVAGLRGVYFRKHDYLKTVSIISFIVLSLYKHTKT